MHSWARRRDLGLLRDLLDAGADVNTTNYRGEAVLMRFAGEMGEIFYPHHKYQNIHYFTKTCDQLLRVYPQRE